ncbi:MAG: response regulator transcription factor [Chloroflexi bacterium]|nr:response regulator transcription factor [Chloroflexota bacterium]
MQQGRDLSPRETSVVRLVARGMTNAQIARELGLRETTVKGYLERIFLKTGVDSRTSLGVWWTRREKGAG